MVAWLGELFSLSETAQAVPAVLLAPRHLQAAIEGRGTGVAASRASAGATPPNKLGRERTASVRRPGRAVGRAAGTLRART